MTELLKKLARGLIAAQLSDPATRQSLHAYVNTQVNTEFDKIVAALGGVVNPFVHAVFEAVKDPTVNAKLDALVDAEFDALLAVLMAKL